MVLPPRGGVVAKNSSTEYWAIHMGKFRAIYRAIEEGQIKLKREGDDFTVIDFGPYWPELVLKAVRRANPLWLNLYCR
ncbi:hypothetical protein HZB93_04750 [Candidatus Falkowbacteria bacterium]|nr:hypothetical protein [Candidatus Falkowbacteria bacterium]